MSKRKRLCGWLLALCLCFGLAQGAGAASLQIDGQTLTEDVALYRSTTYVPLRAVCALLRPDAQVSWENGSAVVRATGLALTARPGDVYIQANGRMLYAAEGVRLVNGVTLVPIRVLAKALDASVSWDGATRRAVVYSGSGRIASGSSYYDGDALYWLSRIIEAESGGEPLLGKLAVGNVILNRVESADFPDSIYGVIFDDKWGVQFQPVSNGAIYNAPSEQSLLAAKLCLDGASVVGDCLYFLNPELATNFWIMENRPYISTIGRHQFYA